MDCSSCSRFFLPEHDTAVLGFIQLVLDPAFNTSPDPLFQNALRVFPHLPVRHHPPVFSTRAPSRAPHGSRGGGASAPPRTHLRAMAAGERLPAPLPLPFSPHGPASGRRLPVPLPGKTGRGREGGERRKIRSEQPLPAPSWRRRDGGGRPAALTQLCGPAAVNPNPPPPHGPHRPAGNRPAPTSERRPARPPRGRRRRQRSAPGAASSLRPAHLRKRGRKAGSGQKSAARPG